MNNARNVYLNWIELKMGSKLRQEGESYELLEVESDYVHALIKHDYGNGVVMYELYTLREDAMYECTDVLRIFGWAEEPMARMAFKLFCHETPEEVEKMWEANRQIAIYEDENRKLKAIVKKMLEERYC